MQGLLSAGLLIHVVKVVWIAVLFLAEPGHAEISRYPAQQDQAINRPLVDAVPEHKNYGPKASTPSGKIFTAKPSLVAYISQIVALSRSAKNDAAKAPSSVFLDYMEMPKSRHRLDTLLRSNAHQRHATRNHIHTNTAGLVLVRGIAVSARTFNVSSVNEFYAAMASAKAGDTLSLADGDYGDLRLSKLKFSEPVIITSANPDRPASLNSIMLSEVSNLIFDNLDFQFKPTEATLAWSSAFRADNCSNISVTNSSFVGGDAVAGISPDSAPGSQGAEGIMGQPIGNAISIYWSQDIVISNNTITHFTAGVRFNEVDGILLEGNHISDFRKVPVGGGDVRNVTLEGNYFHDPNPWSFGGAGDHGDFVHFWTTPKQTTPSENFVIAGNFFAQGNGTAILGIYLDDNANKMGFRNVLIEDNVIHNGNAQALRMEWVDGLVVRDNTLLQSSGDSQDAPKIYLVGGTKNVLIDNNIYAGVTGNVMDNSREHNVRIVDNLVVQAQDPLSPNYAGDLFAGGAQHAMALGGFLVIPESAADGYGAHQTQFDKTPVQINGFVSESRGEGLALSKHYFDASNLYGPNGRVDLTGATISWDFGDGRGAKGAQAAHSYAHAGDYLATATIVLKTGATVILERTVSVVSPIALLADFDSGIVDNSDYRNLTKVTGDVDLESGENGTSIRITSAKSTVGFAASPEILNNSEFTITMAFKKDVGSEGIGGRSLYFSGTAVIDLSADGISLRGKTSNDEAIMLQASNVGIRDSDWHQVAYTFSQELGSAILYVDGREVARSTGLTGSQFTTSGHGLYLGTPFGTSFPGLLDDVSFLRAALTREQVSSGYEAFERGELPDYLPFGEKPSNEAVIPIEFLPSDLGGSSDEIIVHDPIVERDLGGFKLDLQSLGEKSLLRSAAIISEDGTPMIKMVGDGGYVKVGRIEDYESSERLAFSVDFSRSDADGSVDRLVWNHLKVGLTLSGDGLILNVATADDGFKSITIGNIGLNDTDRHNAVVMLDESIDRIQVLLDGDVVLDETSTDVAFVNAGSKEYGWFLGTPWNRFFDGQIMDFQVGDSFSFVGDPVISWEQVL